MTYVGVVLSNMGGSPNATPLVVAPLPCPSTTVNGPFWKACCRAQPCCCISWCHHPHALSPSDKILPSHPHPTLEGLSMPTVPPKLLARATSRLGMTSLVPSLMASSTPSLLPFTFGGKVCLSSEGGTAIHSVLMVRHHCHRSTHNASTSLVVLADVMAPGLPIYRSTFFVGGIISPMLPINNQSTLNGWVQLVEGGTHWLTCWRFFCFLVFWRHLEILLLSVLLEALGGFWCCLFFWSHFLGDSFLGGRLPSFCLPSFDFSVYCWIINCSSFASCA